MAGFLKNLINTNVDATMQGLYRNAINDSMQKSYNNLRSTDQLWDDVAEGMKDAHKAKGQKQYSGAVGPQPEDYTDKLARINQEKRAQQTNVAVAESQVSNQYNSPIGPQQASQELTQESVEAANKGNVYDWMTNKMGLTPEGAKAPDYSGGIWDGTKNTAKWFVTGSGMDKTKKIALGAAAYGAGNMMLRGASGGGATYNNTGQRDIAGVPFV